MWDEIVSMAMNNGLWAVLFCLLFLYEIKDSRKREHKYQDAVASLTKSAEFIRDVKEDCLDIKKDASDIKDDCLVIKKDTRDVKQDSVEIKKGICEVKSENAEVKKDICDVKKGIEGIRQEIKVRNATTVLRRHNPVIPICERDILTNDAKRRMHDEIMA